MVRERIVTEEIARQIYYSFEALRLDGEKSIEAYKKIQSDVKKDFGRNVSLLTVEKFSYKTFDEVANERKNYKKTESFRESQRKYWKSGKGKAARRRYQQSKKGGEANRRGQRKHWERMKARQGLNLDFSND